MPHIVKILLYTLVCCLSTNINPSDGLRILGLYPLQMKSHYIFSEAVMTEMARRGHRVDAYSHFPPKKAIPNFKHFNLDGTLPSYSNNVTVQDWQSISIFQLVRQWLEELTEPQCNLMESPIFQELLHNPPKDPAYDLVMMEVGAFHCYYAWGRHLDVPVIGTVPTPHLMDWLYKNLGAPVNHAADPCINCPYTAPMTFFQRLDNFLSANYLVHIYNSISPAKQDRMIEKIFGPGYPSAIDLDKEISLVLLNHDLAVSGVRPSSPNVVSVGGLHITDDANDTLDNKDVKTWLDESESGCVYVSLGSMVRFETLPRPVLDALLNSFENIAPVRVLLKVGKEEVLSGLPANIMTQPWIDQIQVLKHKNIVAFVTHGGLMGSQESIYYGVPMIGVPLFGDQHFNVANYVKKNIAIKVDLLEITEASFTKALREIIHNPAYKKAVQAVRRQFRDHPLNPMDTAIFWVEYIHRHGKDALKPPVVDLPWWQANLLDVYTFLLSVLIVALGLFVALLKLLVKFFTAKFRPSVRPKVKAN